jgi:hypothetical protein
MRKIFLSVLLPLLLLCGKSFGQTTNYHVFALYVVNIAKYSSWPNMNGELRVAVYGKTKVLEELMKQNGKVVNGSTLKVFQIEGPESLADAHIVYVADGKSNNVEELVTATIGKPVMIITEREGLHKKGAGFSFLITESNSLRFDMNHSELEKRAVKVSKSITTLANSSI